MSEELKAATELLNAYADEFGAATIGENIELTSNMQRRASDAIRVVLAALAKREADDAEHVAWLRYDDHNGMRPTTLHLCDSDAPGAFKVFRTAKREAVAGGVVWQARSRGCSEWSDVCAEHAERLRICSRLVRAVVVVSPESDIPIAERAMLAASQQAAKEPEYLEMPDFLRRDK